MKATTATLLEPSNIFSAFSEDTLPGVGLSTPNNGDIYGCEKKDAENGRNKHPAILARAGSEIFSKNVGGICSIPLLVKLYNNQYLFEGILLLLQPGTAGSGQQGKGSTETANRL